MKRTKDTTQLTSHTPEPWHYQTEYRITTIFATDPTGENPYGTYIAEIDGQDVGRFATSEQHEANARRICAAVNACQGVPTEALESGATALLASAAPRLLASLITCANLLADYDESDGEEGQAYREALAAIDEATGRPA